MVLVAARPRERSYGASRQSLRRFALLVLFLAAGLVVSMYDDSKWLQLYSRPTPMLSTSLLTTDPAWINKESQPGHSLEAKNADVSVASSEGSEIAPPPSPSSLQNRNNIDSAAHAESPTNVATAPGQQTVAKNLTLNRHLINRFVVVPEYKLVLCSIDKVGSMMFIHLMRMLRLLHPDLPEKKVTSQTRRIWGGNIPSRFRMTNVEMADILFRTYKGEKWTTAVFYRDPVARFISAYKSKCGHADHDGAGICRRVFGNSTVSFRDAVHTPQEKMSNDVHFKLQTTMCGGLNADTLPYYTFVREFKPENTEGDIRDIFASSGVPNNVTEALITSVVKNRATNLDADEELIRTHSRWTNLTFTRQAVLSPKHITSQVMQDKNDYNDPELVQILAEKYKEDYETFYHRRPWLKS